MMIEFYEIEVFLSDQKAFVWRYDLFVSSEIRSSMLPQLSIWAESQDAGPEDFRFVGARDAKGTTSL
jgi:hypothetical protein